MGLVDILESIKGVELDFAPDDNDAIALVPVPVIILEVKKAESTGRKIGFEQRVEIVRDGRRVKGKVDDHRFGIVLLYCDIFSVDDLADTEADADHNNGDRYPFFQKVHPQSKVYPTRSEIILL